MTDRPSTGGDGRIDLRALDAADPGREDRVVAAALARIAANPARDPGDELSGIVIRYIRPAVAAAAVLAAAAIGTVVLTNRAGNADPRQPVAMLANWAESQHVPTNGELLLAFQGYGGKR